MHSCVPRVLIIGGGLAGLTAARQLHRAGVAFQLLEARDRLGGRMLSTDASGSVASDGLDLGPSWFWPALQPALAAFIAELGVATFPQYSAGDILVQRTWNDAPLRYPGMQQGPVSTRIVGGAGALVGALAASLPATSIHLQACVTHIALDGAGVALDVVMADGQSQRLHADGVLCALPPRLLEATVSFSPALDAQTARRWRATPTWMAPHAKFVARYAQPFWRDAGLSGTAQSMVGPLVEIHDATTASDDAALFGFVGVAPDQRAAVGEDAVVAASVRQLVSLFGPQAAAPLATLYKDWAADPLTATAADRTAGEHPTPDRRPWVGEEWQRHLLLAGSETSSTEPGYLAGAVQAAERAVHELLVHLRTDRELEGLG